MTERLTIRGRDYELTVKPQPGGPEVWHWILAAPGKLVLAGEAASKQQARRSARRAGRTLARIGRTH